MNDRSYSKLLISKNIIVNMIRFEKAFGGSESRCFFDM